MNFNVLTYLLYLALALPLTLWVARTLRRYGEVFLVDVFNGDESLAHAVNHLLVVGFYLVNLGYVALFMTSSADIGTARRVVEVFSTKIGAVALFLGVVHFGNIWAFNAFRRRAVQRSHAAPPVPPTAPPPRVPSAYPPPQWPGWPPPGAPVPAPPPAP